MARITAAAHVYVSGNGMISIISRANAAVLSHLNRLHAAGQIHLSLARGWGGYTHEARTTEPDLLYDDETIHENYLITLNEEE